MKANSNGVITHSGHLCDIRQRIRIPVTADETEAIEVLQGIQESVQKGPLAAYPVVGVKATLYEVADKVKDIWTDFAGFNCQTQFFPEYAKDYENYESPFDPILDLSDEFYFMRKFTINYLVFKKHAKMLSVYAGEDGMFNKRAKYVIEDEHHIPIRDADPDEPGAVKKNFTPYEVLMKSSKRWSSRHHSLS